MDKSIAIQIVAVNQPVLLVVGNLSYYVGCDGDGVNGKLGLLSLRNCETGEVRPCDEIERAEVKSAIVCCGNDRARTLPTFKHGRKEHENWWQMIVNSMPAKTPHQSVFATSFAARATQ